MSSTDSPIRLRYPRTARLSGKLAFSAVYDGKRKTTAGPLVIFALVNGLEISRLGLSVSRRVGTAPRRVRIKRRLREVFRLNRPDLPKGFDWIVVVRPHDCLSVRAYTDLFVPAVRRLADRAKKP